MTRLALLVLPLFLFACEPKTEGTTDAWIGRWQGPEGTYLDIQREGYSYVVEIADLDGPRRFVGKASEGKIAFERDGIQENIHAGTGRDTGMKWLLDKGDCLIVKTGEGYCRD